MVAGTNQTLSNYPGLTSVGRYLFAAGGNGDFKRYDTVENKCINLPNLGSDYHVDLVNYENNIIRIGDSSPVKGSDNLKKRNF